MSDLTQPPTRYSASEAFDIVRGMTTGDAGIGFAQEQGRYFVDVDGARFYGRTFNEAIALAKKSLG